MKHKHLGLLPKRRRQVAFSVLLLCKPSMLSLNESHTVIPATDIIARTERILKFLDGMFGSTVLSCAAMLPGLAGISAAIATVAFDLSHRYWIGALLSGLSTIPLAGYVPGALKIAWNVRMLNRQLDQIEALLPEIEQESQLLSRVQEIVGKHSVKLHKVPVAARLSAKLERIMNAKARSNETLPS